jgi:hypothetical protein
MSLRAVCPLPSIQDEHNNEVPGLIQE